jgi:uncharacterized protein YjiS (DUF1127 family)
MEKEMNTLNGSWSTDYQHRVMSEARRQQALAAAEVFGGAYAAVAKYVTAAVSSIARAVTQARQMAELSQLSDRQLADIGIKRSDIPHIVVGGPIGHFDQAVPNLKVWRPARASNDWQDSAAA